MTLSNEQEEVLGHAAFYDYPNVPGVDQSDWEEWMNQTYDCRSCTPLNTLFMHYFVAKPEYSHGCAKEIIRTMYNAVPELHFCFLIVPTGVYPGRFEELMETFDIFLDLKPFIPVEPKGGRPIFGNNFI